MTLTANKRRRLRAVDQMVLGKATPATSTQYFQGGLLAMNGSDVLVKAAATDGFRIAGVCPSEELTGASVSGQRVFEFGHEEWFAHSGLTAGSVGRDAFVVDDDTVGPGPGGREPDQSFAKAADGAAGTTTAETVIGYVHRACKLVAVRYVPAAGVTADATNNATITVSKRASGGGSKTTVATIVTDVAGGNWTQWAAKAFSLTGTAADLQIAAGSGLTFEIAKGGTGVVIPAGVLELMFDIGTQVRVGEIKGFETFDGVAGAWLAIARFSGRDA